VEAHRPVAARAVGVLDEGVEAGGLAGEERPHRIDGAEVRARDDLGEWTEVAGERRELDAVTTELAPAVALIATVVGAANVTPRAPAWFAGGSSNSPSPSRSQVSVTFGGAVTVKPPSTPGRSSGGISTFVMPAAAGSRTVTSS
jgi:hypothetical protein